MHIVVKTVDVCTIEAVVMVACDQYLMAMGKLDEPFEEIYGFLF